MPYYSVVVAVLSIALHHCCISLVLHYHLLISPTLLQSTVSGFKGKSLLALTLLCLYTLRMDCFLPTYVI